MNQKQLIELIQQHHPSAGETEIRKALNRAQDDFSSKTEILRGTYTETSVAGQRNYPLHREMIKVYRVDIGKYMDIQTKYNISAIPTLIVFNNGNIEKQFDPNIMFQLEASKNDVQDVIDEIMLKQFE